MQIQWFKHSATPPKILALKILEILRTCKASQQKKKLKLAIQSTKIASTDVIFMFLLQYFNIATETATRGVL